MIEYVKNTFDFNVYGQEVSLRKPLVKEIRSFSKKMSESDSDESVLLGEFLETLGLPKGLSEEMEPKHLEDMIQVVTDQKKS